MIGRPERALIDRVGETSSTSAISPRHVDFPAVAGRGRRVAFLTTEFPTEPVSGGGLASYLDRMTQALRAEGHRPEVFVISRSAPETIERQGVLVHRVAVAHDDPRLRIARAACHLLRLRQTLPLVLALGAPLALARALARREREQPFDLVQSSDYRAVGLFVRSSPGRPHVLRCSSAVELFLQADGTAEVAKERWRQRLERAAIRRADAAYAPSELVAEHYGKQLGRRFPVVRPPLLFESGAAASVPWELPRKYFIHFGRLIQRKGTKWLAEALPRVWREEPGFRMVFAGPQAPEFEEWTRGWGENRSKVLLLPSVAKPDLYHLLEGADAAVLPSLVDNLPNTVIESLMFGIPVVGSAGASIDELVEDGVSGTLVPIGDTEALAAALVRQWRGEGSARKGFAWRSATRREMEPDRAVAALLALAGLSSHAT